MSEKLVINYTNGSVIPIECNIQMQHDLLRFQRKYSLFVSDHFKSKKIFCLQNYFLFLAQAEQAIEYTKELLKKIEDIMYP